MSDTDFLSKLNPSQRDAVEYIEGPSLVIAGAGSGKTMVLTYKIAYLLSQGMQPYNILALTFTNKAAREMRARIGNLVGEFEASSLWMGTFHSVFNRILRREAQVFGFTPDYTIYDTSDSRSLVNSIIKEMQLDDKVYKVGSVQNRISEAKNRLITPAEYAVDAETLKRDANSRMPLLYQIYRNYCMRCRQANAMDFDDLLLYTFLLFEKFPEVCRRYSERFHYILVDEYQDTNYAQHMIMLQLSKQHNRICVVGDDAQSIYSFRGANIDNILQFQGLYKGAQLFKLERNYRSTRNIVGAANSLISKNDHQIPKTIYSENDVGEPLSIKYAFSDVEEGEIVCNQIRYLVRQKHLKYDQIAILYRTNAQSRIFEETLRKHGVPYRVYGGQSFYDRKIIKNALAYLRLIVNPNDEEAFKRIVNYPVRGIGDVTVGKVLKAAHDQNVGVWTVMESPQHYGVQVNAGTLAKLQSFYNLINEFREDQSDAYVLGNTVFQKSGIMSEVNSDTTPEGIERKNNLSELVNGMSNFVSSQLETGAAEHIYVTDYLSEVALLSDTDDQETENQDMVTLMTVHSSKGLEYDAVFVVGMEEELFPNQNAMYSQRELEEERRLFYVAITRSKTYCMLSCAKSRFRFGQIDFYSPSRFLKEIDPQFIQSERKPVSSSHPNIFRETRQEQNPVRSVLKPIPSRPYSNTLRRVAVSQDHETASLSSVMINHKPCGVGTLVEHARFGEGEIKALSGSPDNATATILFRHVGEKKLLLKYAKLNILS